MTGESLLIRIPGFIFRTPNDSEPFCSYSSCAIDIEDFERNDGDEKVSSEVQNDVGSEDDANDKGIKGAVQSREQSKKTFTALLITDHLNQFDLETTLPLIPKRLLSTEVPMVMFPSIFLARHIKWVSKELIELVTRVEKIEGRVAAGPEFEKLDDEIRELTACNTQLVKLERRWQFQAQLATSVQEFLNAHRNSTFNQHETKVNIGNINSSNVTINNQGYSNDDDQKRTAVQNNPDFVVLNSRTGFQRKLITASEYDLNVLSRRISNQFTAVRHLPLMTAERLTEYQLGLQHHCSS